MQSTRSQLGNSVLHSTHGTLDRESSLSQHVTERQHNQTGRIPSDTEGIIKDSTKVLQGLCSYQYPVGTQSAETGRSAYMTSQQSSHLYASERPFTRNTTSQGGTRMDWYSLVEEPRTLESWFGYGGVARSQVEVDSNVIQISPAFGCIMVRSNTMKPVPELLKVSSCSSLSLPSFPPSLPPLPLPQFQVSLHGILYCLFRSRYSGLSMLYNLQSLTCPRLCLLVMASVILIS